jgi:hypothetical protein
MHGHHPETHNYGPACARTGLAAPRRPSLVIQKIRRLGIGVANDWRGRAMTKTVERHEHQDGGGVELPSDANFVFAPCPQFDWKLESARTNPPA